MNIADELCKWADQLSEQENEFGVVVRALVASLRRAADAIWQLRDDLQRIKIDNIKLQNDANLLRAMLSQVQTEKRCYIAENTKLWELAKNYEALTATLCNERECDGCPFDDPKQIVCEHMRIQTCLSELGVKVDAE